MICGARKRYSGVKSDNGESEAGLGDVCFPFQGYKMHNYQNRAADQFWDEPNQWHPSSVN
jgi:hypothetical protein